MALIEVLRLVPPPHCEFNKQALEHNLNGRRKLAIKVVDLFAGPGGLGEGFSAHYMKGKENVFEIVLSIEKEKHAFETLKLRTFFRRFRGDAPREYYSYLKGELELQNLYDAYPDQSRESEDRCWQKEIGLDEDAVSDVRRHIGSALDGDELGVLIGGPPCQAYSLAGRSRNAGNPNYDPDKDRRQKLYIDYLQVVADHSPAVFIMENVKGLLSATMHEQSVFNRIVEDLRNPTEALRREKRKTASRRHSIYRIHSLTDGSLLLNGNVKSAVVRAEHYGIPQSRHRVILLGLRDDLGVSNPPTMTPSPEVTLKNVIGDLPKLRSGLSGNDSDANWRDALRSQSGSNWIKGKPGRLDQAEFSEFMKAQMGRISPPRLGRGKEFIESETSPEHEPGWFKDARLKGITHHRARSHMASDLWRYFYAECYARFNKSSPTLTDMPRDLLPEHANVQKAIKSGGNFSDRFRVQLWDKPATTVVSHISKDGHYYIHPDPQQCRSLTVREVARVQTFPDNYYFMGNRTAQYVQVGNAVPPLLAYQIAGVVNEIFLRLQSVQD